MRVIVAAMRVVSVCVALLGGGGPLAHAQAYHRSIPYDPSTCSSDAHDMVFFAVGRRVLRQPRPNLVYITGYMLNELIDLPRPPKPDDPEGCPDHPIQGAAYTLSHISAMPDDVRGNTPSYADRVRLVVNAGRGVLKGIVEENDLFDLICKKYSLPDNSVPGFRGCKKPFHCDEDVAYLADDYTSPDGTKLALFCMVGVGCSPKPIDCNGAYSLHSDFAVNFQFATPAVPVDKFIEADREVRRRIEAAEVKDFRWSPSLADLKRGKSP
jgi:hypothetical protein